MVQMPYIQATQYMLAPVDLNIRRPRQRSIFQNDTQSEDAFFCDTFHVLSAGSPLENSDNTIPCSVAQDIIQQYNVDDVDMNWIKACFATGFW
jgi:hypothetical protein